MGQRRVRRTLHLAAGAAAALCLVGVLPAQAAEGLGTDAGSAQEAVASDTVVVGTIEQAVVDPAAEFTRTGGPTTAGTRPSDPVLQTFVRLPGRLVRLSDAQAHGRRPREAVTVSLRHGQVAAVTAGSWLPVGGRRTPLTAAATATTAAAAAAAVAAAAAPTLVAPPVAAGAHNLVVLPVHWGVTDGQTVTSLTALAQQTARYWSQQSGGAVQVTTSVRPWTRIADPGSCDADLITGRALAAAGLAWPTSSRSHVVFYFPRRSDCAWAGLGTVGGSLIWVNGYPLTDVLSHEFGHNLGLGHANAARCTDAGGTPVPLSSTCTVEEYNDGADVMGFARYSASGSLNTALGDALGLVRTVTADPNAPTTVTLAPLSDVSGVRAVKIPVSAGTLYVDFRPATGEDVREPNWAGVQVHLRPAGAIPTSQLLDLQPDLGKRVHPQLSAHLVWVVPGTGLSLVVDATGTTATVSVTPIAGDVTAPTPAAATATLTTSPSGVASVDVSWTASNDVGTGVASYTVRAGSTLLGRAGPSDTSLSAVLTDPTATVRVDAEDAAGNVSAGAEITPADGGLGPEPPAGGGGGGATAPADTTAPGGVLLVRPSATLVQTSRSVLLSWRAATDLESGIAGYQITANGIVLGSLASLSVTVTGLPEGRTTLLVAAVDGAGLVGPARQATVVVDTMAPTAPLRLGLSNGVLSWAAPADTGTALRYQVLRDGTLVATGTARSLKVAVAVGRHVWTVRAVDTVGHVSPTSRLTVTRTGTVIRTVAG